jgi:FAD dependent oxidoreductase
MTGLSDGEYIEVAPESIPVAGDYDVVVCGGGPAGIGAAYAAARGGAKTLLIEQRTGVGGIACGAFIQSFMDSPHGPLLKEIVAELIETGAAKMIHADDYSPVGRVRFKGHCATLQALYTRKLHEAGVAILFCTIAESAWTDETGRVRGVFVANKSGRTLIRARTVIDTSADGDIAASAGAEVMKGDPEDGRMQHVNFKAELTDYDFDRYTREHPSADQIMTWLKKARGQGDLHPPEGAFLPPTDTFPFDMNREVPVLSTKYEIANVDPSDPWALSKTLTECQLATEEVVAFARKHLPGYEHCRIAIFPPLLGTRESRRIVGDYVLTGDDVRQGAKFDDGVVRADFMIDFHDPPPGPYPPFWPEYRRTQRPRKGDWYEIPYRCLVPKGVSGLLVAGRCISADREAQASSRVMTTSLYMGTAAGTAAAMTLREGISVEQVDGTALKAFMEQACGLT